MRPKISNSSHRYPDARVKGVQEFLAIVRNEKEWNPETISLETLKTLGISPGKETNAIYVFKFLKLIDASGRPSEHFFQLRENYSDTLSKLIKSSYQGVFNNIPISLISQRTLVNFFTQKDYSVETAEYQAKLFVTLCAEAGIKLPNVEKSFKRARFDKEK